MYDLCFRALQGLPLPSRALTTLIIESILGRILRAEDIIVCGFVWMSNHVHMQVFSLDCDGVSNFHGCLKKRLTDFLKRLLDLPRLNLWDNRTTIGEVIDIEAAIDRIVYSYLNPIRANLARSIDEYRGFNTWRDFLSAPADVDACIEREVPWIQVTDITPLSNPNPSPGEEQSLIREILRRVERRQKHKVKIKPFKWLEAFNITERREIKRIKRQIIKRVRQEERKLQSDKAPLDRLEGYDVTDAYVPTKKERKVFVYTSVKELLWRYLEGYRRFEVKCRRCFELMRCGAKDIPWPPECFKPPGPRVLNAF